MHLLALLGPLAAEMTDFIILLYTSTSQVKSLPLFIPVALKIYPVRAVNPPPPPPTHTHTHTHTHSH